MSKDDLEHAAELLARLLPHATPAPWIDGSVEGNRYHALVHTGCSRDCDNYAAKYLEQGRDVPGWLDHHPHDGYGGCLVAESIHHPDRRLLAVLRNVADHLPALLQAVAHEDPIEVGRAARTIAAEITDTHRPRPNASPPGDTYPPERVTPR